MHASTPHRLVDLLWGSVPRSMCVLYQGSGLMSSLNTRIHQDFFAMNEQPEFKDTNFEAISPKGAEAIVDALPEFQPTLS